MFPSDIKKLIEKGASVVLEEKLLPNTLKDLAESAKISGAKISVVANHYSTSVQEELISILGQNVTFVVKSS